MTTPLDLINILRPRPAGTGRFALRSPIGGTPRVFGGQLIAQAILAAGGDVPEERTLHSLQASFIGPGNPGAEMQAEVELLKSGASFTINQVSISQAGKLLFRAIASFQKPEQGDTLLHRGAVPPAIEGMIDESEFLVDMPDDSELNPSIQRSFFTGLIERRSKDWIHPANPGTYPDEAGFWCRFRGPLPDITPLMHQALLGYLSDLDILHTAMRPRGIGTRHPQTMSATLSHSMWFHAPLRADDWFYCDLAGRGVYDNLGLGIGGMCRPDGTLAISVVQEGLLRHSPSPRR
jgi:acyl-CoA thioesterase-2